MSPKVLPFKVLLFQTLGNHIKNDLDIAMDVLQCMRAKEGLLHPTTPREQLNLVCMDLILKNKC